MNPTQLKLKAERLLAEEQMIVAQQKLGAIVRSCTEHYIIRGRLIFSPREQKVVLIESEYSASCEICGVEFGWYCPVNPKRYCEYGEDDEICIHCGEPDERK